MKKCNKCKVEKSLDQFYKDSTVTSGVRGQCKPCDNSIERGTRDLRRQQIDALNAQAAALVRDCEYNTRRYHEVRDALVSLKRNELKDRHRFYNVFPHASARLQIICDEIQKLIQGSGEGECAVNDMKRLLSYMDVEIDGLSSEFNRREFRVFNTEID